MDEFLVLLTAMMHQAEEKARHGTDSEFAALTDDEADELGEMADYDFFRTENPNGEYDENFDDGYDDRYFEDDRENENLDSVYEYYFGDDENTYDCPASDESNMEDFGYHYWDPRDEMDSDM